MANSSDDALVSLGQLPVIRSLKHRLASVNLLALKRQKSNEINFLCLVSFMTITLSADGFPRGGFLKGVITLFRG